MAFAPPVGPMWRQDAFLDYYLDGVLPAPYSQTQIKGILPTLGQIIQTLQGVLRYSGEWLKPFSGPQIQNINSVLRSFHQLGEMVSRVPAGAGDAASLERLLVETVSLIGRTKIGSPLILPGGWMTTETEGDVVLIVVERTSEDEFCLSVVNSHPSVPYHLESYRSDSGWYGQILKSSISGNKSPGHLSDSTSESEEALKLSSSEDQASLPTQIPSLRRQFIVSFKKIPAQRLMDSSFWYLLYRPLVYPNCTIPGGVGKKDREPGEVLYEVLLPALNSKPLLSSCISVDPSIRWCRPPIHGDRTGIHCLLECLYFCLCRITSAKHARYILFLMTWEIGRVIRNDLETCSDLSLTDLKTVQLSLKQFAAIGAEEGAQPDSLVGDEMKWSFLKFLEEIEKFVEEKRLEPSPNFVEWEQNGIPPVLSIPEFVKWKPFNRLDCFQNKGDEEKFAGESRMKTYFRPVEFTVVPPEVTCYHDLQLALRHVDHICSLLSYQSNTIENTYLHRVALIQHTFLRVIPLPLPQTHPDRERLCFYSRPLNYAEQNDLLSTLLSVCRHFTAVSMSLELTRSLDSTRILTMSCMATIADAIVRIPAADTSCRFTLHMQGKGGGPFPGLPFGFDVSLSFAKQSESMIFSDPNLCATRTRVLDYFQMQRSIIPPEHVMFRWEQSQQFGEAEKKLLLRLCHDIGFPPQSDLLPMYLSEDLPEFLDFFPLLKHYRDIVYIFKFTMAPDASSFPPVRPWLQKSASLRWKFDKAIGFKVVAFGKELQCVCAPETQKEEGKSRGLFSAITAWFFKQTRSPSSGADPRQNEGSNPVVKMILISWFAPLENY